MAASDFTPERISIGDLLSRRYYLIPRFQRPFAWDAGNVEELWSDAFEGAEKGYFIGPMVGWRKTINHDTANIVDGQQRLTTIMLFISVLVEKLDEAGQKRLANGLHRYVERKDDNDDNRYVLKAELGGHFLTGTLLARTPDKSLKAANDEEKGLEGARHGLQALLEEDLAGHPDAKARVKRLTELRDRVLALQLIWIEHRDEDDAYVVFETLNSRGKDLEPVDLLKNLLLARLKTNNKGGDVPAERWRRLRTQLEDADVSANAFILHWWLSQEAYVAQRKLFQKIKGAVKSEAQAEERLKSLENDAPRYRTLRRPETATWQLETFPIRDALMALQIFNMSQPAPLLLAMLRARDAKSPKFKELVDTFRFVESFHYQFTAIAARSSSGGISERYAKYARALSGASDSADRALVLQEFRKIQAPSLPESGLVKDAFKRLTFTNDITKDKKLIEYTLRKLHQSAKKTSPTATSIEHLLSQDQIAAAGEEVVGNIGNLLWIDSGLNAQLANKSFSEKQSILKKHANDYDIADVLAASTWGAAEINARAARLADLAIDTVWGVPTASSAGASTAPATKGVAKKAPSKRPASAPAKKAVAPKAAAKKVVAKPK